MTDATLGVGAMRPASSGDAMNLHPAPAGRHAASGAPGASSISRAAVKDLLLSFAHRLTALLILIAIAPLVTVIAIAVYVQDRGPIFFAHPRLGLHGREFRCLKFRSMGLDAEARLAQHLSANPAAREEWLRDHKLRDDPRITPIGRFLRRSSLDELPQLLNVIRGEMSLVGPRPIVAAEVAKYKRRFRHYASVKPGITGLWQVSGRNNTPYSTRVALDCLYASRRCMIFDFIILLRTIPAVLLRQGSY